MAIKKICARCGKQMDEINFYTYPNGQKTQYCKDCFTAHIDNFDPETFLWILEKMNVPYIEEEWNKIRDKAYAKNPNKMTGKSVLGKYLSQMKLKQWKKYTWADTEKLKEETQRKKQLAKIAAGEQAQIAKEQYQRGEISQAQYRTLTSTQYQHEKDLAPANINPIGQNNMFDEREFLSKEDMPDFAAQLTLEEKQMLALKWGRTYKISEWIELERLYKEMTDSFDIHDADSKSALIFICKTNLKMNQALDCGDVEGYQKLSRVYDTLRKSAKFTAAQNKEEKAGFIDSVGQLVAYCQKNKGQIPRFEIQAPKDIVDKVITDLKDYNRSLIYQDTALARQIEDYIKEARAAAEKKRDTEEAKAQGLETRQLTVDDMLQYKEFLKKEKEATEQQQRGNQDESTTID